MSEKEDLERIFKSESQNSVFDEIDFRRLKYVFSKYGWFVIFFLMLGLGIAYAVIRWTKPLYEADSIIKLDLKSQNEVLGEKFGAGSEDDLSSLVGEMEIIKSNVIFEELIDSLDVEISYYEKGKILIDEHYKEANYEVLFVSDSNNIIFDRDIHVEFVSNTENYVYVNEAIKIPFQFGETINLEGFDFKIFKTNKFDSGSYTRDYYFRLNSHDYLLNYFQKGLKVEIENAKAKTLRIAFESYDSKKAYDVVKEIIQIYQHRSLEVKRKVQQQTISFIDDQLKQAKTNLNRAEINMENFIISSGSMDPKQEILHVKDKLAELEQQKEDIKIQIGLLNEVHNFIKNDKGTDKGLPFVDQIESPALKNSILQINELYREFELLKATTKPTTLAFKNKLIALQTLKVDISENVFQAKSILDNKLQEVNLLINQLEKEFLSLPAKETEANRLKRFYSLWENFYLFLINKKVEYGITKAGMTSEFIILKNPSLPASPIKPEPVIILVSSISVSILIGLIALVVGYVRSNTIFSAKDIERGTKAPLLAQIPLYTAKKMKYSRFLVLNNPKSSISEAFRSLRTNLTFLSTRQDQAQVISITSTIGGEGKTFVASNLAGVLAISGKKVVLLDLDLRKPKVHLAFDHENDSSGISSILIGEKNMDECLRDTSIPSLKYFNAGATPPNPSELLLRLEFTKLLEDLKERFDYIIVDTPPIGLVTDGLLVMKHSSIQLYVAKARYSKLEVIKEIDELYKSRKFPQLALVLNGVKNLSNKYGYRTYGYYEDD